MARLAPVCFARRSRLRWSDRHPSGVIRVPVPRPLDPTLVLKAHEIGRHSAPPTIAFRNIPPMEDRPLCLRGKVQLHCAEEIHIDYFVDMTIMCNIRWPMLLSLKDSGSRPGRKWQR